MTTAGGPGATEAIRAAVEELAERIGRSVVVNDPLVRQVYGSRHFDDEDRVRIRAILQHDAGADVVAHVLAQGVVRWSRPGRILGAPELDLLPRWCAPLRAHGMFLGTLMVIDARDDLTDLDRAAIADTADAVATRLSAERLTADTARGERDGLLRGLLSADPDERHHAENGARELDIPDRPHLVAMVAEVISPHRTAAQIELAVRRAGAAVENSPRIPGTSAVSARRADVLQHWIADPRPDGLRIEADRIRQNVMRALGVTEGCHVGVGAPATAFAELRNAHRQAALALHAARALPRLDGVAVWSELGVYAPLLSIADAPSGSPAALALARVRAHAAGPRLLQTMRVFLDEAGNVPRAAKVLTLHRTSLRYRLTQIEEITGMDLDSGSDRLAQHVQLRLEEIVGI